MSIGHLTKQLAEQAVKSTILSSDATPSAPEPESTAAVMFAQLGAMQSAAKEDQDVVVLCSAAGQNLRVLEVFMPSGSVLVITGHDPDRNLIRAICAAETVQLAFKLQPAAAAGKPARVRLVVPKK